MPNPDSIASPVAPPEAQAFVELLRTSQTVSAFCHENPDGDTLGAAVAVALLAERLGKRTEVIVSDDVPPAYVFLTESVTLRRRPQLEPGLAVVLDAASLERIGPMLTECAEWFASATIINIDHHATNQQFGVVNLVDPGAAATCQVIAELLPTIGLGLDRAMASALLTGLIRDSQGFSTESTSARTLAAAAAAIEAGANIERIYRSTLLDLPLHTMALWGRLLAEMETSEDGRIVHAVLRPEMLTATQAAQHDAEGFVEFLARGSGVEIGLLLRELEEGTRVSLRVGPGLDATRIAAEFSGGGHARRAGCFIRLPADEAVPLVLAACRRALGDANRRPGT